MGSFPSRNRNGHFKYIAPRVEARLGKIPLLTRYHQEPHRLEDDYEVTSTVLGSGANGAVHMALSKSSSRKVAVKSFSLANMNDFELNLLSVEVGNYLSMDHPHIARLLDVYESADHIHLVMECMSGGDLVERVESRSRFTETEARDAIRQILLALNYMHSSGFVHRDVKPDNVLYDTNGGDHLKLIDFGFSTRWDSSSKEKMHLNLGTREYVAPEVLDESYTSKCDLWSTGVVAFILLTGRFPFHGSDAELKRKIRAGSYPSMDGKLWSGVSDEAKDFVRSLLRVDPSERLSAEEALQHSWIATRPSKVQNGIGNVAESLRQYANTSNLRRSELGALSWSLVNEVQAKVRDHFVAINTSQKGVLTLDELRQVMIDQLPTMSEHDILKTFKVLDTSHDGTVHYSDFLAAMMNSMLSAYAPAVQSKPKITQMASRSLLWSLLNYA